MREDLLLQVSNLCLMAANLYFAYGGGERSFGSVINFDLLEYRENDETDQIGINEIRRLTRYSSVFLGSVRKKKKTNVIGEIGQMDLNYVSNECA